MKDVMIVLLIYLIANFCVFGIYAYDKQMAIQGKWRVSEAFLLCVAILGVFGALAGMYFMHHKTKKIKFVVGVPAILIVECIILVFTFFH